MCVGSPSHYPSIHIDRTDDTLDNIHSETDNKGEQYGPVHVTAWTEWTTPNGSETEYSSCQTDGTRTISTLARHRFESMHTAFVPAESYDINSVHDGHTYRLGWVRNMSLPPEDRWRMALISDTSLTNNTITTATEELRFLPDISFHDILVQQSLHPEETLPVGPTLVMTHTGRTMCPHSTYGLSSAPEGTQCRWDFGTLDSDIGFQLASSSGQPGGDPAIGLKARVTHFNSTFYNGSLFSVVGVDLRARYVSESLSTFAPVDITSQQQQFVSHAQLAADLNLTNYLGDPEGQGFVPPLTMRVATAERKIFIQTLTEEMRRSLHPPVDTGGSSAV